MFIYIEKNYISRFIKTTYNLEWSVELVLEGVAKLSDSPDKHSSVISLKIPRFSIIVGLLTEVHPGISQPSSYLPTGYLLSQDHSARLPGRQALDWTSEGSSEDQDQGADMYSGYLGI